MNIWAKMITALRGGVNETGEAIVDNQALRILDQEIREASEELKQSKDSLAAIIAREKLSREKYAAIDQQITEHEDYALQALEKENEDLALEIAEKIATLEVQLSNEKEACSSFAESAQNLRTVVNQSETNLKRLKQQVDTVKATENVLRAQEVVAERNSGSSSRLRTAMDSLERIKEKQALKAATMKAAADLVNETGDNRLATKLEEAGITKKHKDATAILDKLKKQKSKRT